MELHEIRIKLTSALGSPLKGDTIFGHFCWQIAHDSSLADGGLEKVISQYREKPFAIFSSAYPVFGDGSKRIFALKKPVMPFEFFSLTAPEDRSEYLAFTKEFKKKKWMQVEDLSDLNPARLKFVSDEELFNSVESALSPSARRLIQKTGYQSLLISEKRTHNSINRLSQTTGSGQFAPYIQEDLHYHPETELAIFVLLDEEITSLDGIEKGFTRLGQWGYGRDASTGLGHFKIISIEKLEFPESSGCNACYTLGPTVPEKNMYENMYFQPFVRFGKHGDIMARSSNPFKNPILMADEAAVFVPRDRKTFEKPYLGRAVTEISQVQPQAVTQGYSLYLPLSLEAQDAG